jgi:hypothetical protein
MDDIGQDKSTEETIETPRRLMVSWPAKKLAELAELANVTPPGMHPIESRLAAAQLCAASGDLDQAEADVLDAVKECTTAAVLRDEVIVPVLTALFIVQRLDVAASILQDRHSPGCNVELRIAEGTPGFGRIICDFLLPESIRFTFDASVLRPDYTRGAVLGFNWILPVFVAYARDYPGERGTVVFDNWDDAQGPGIAVCSNRTDCFLIPDTAFVPSRGYEWTRRQYREHDVPWQQRRPVAYWRGSTTGRQTDRAIGWRSLPRIRLCEIAGARNDIFDVGISAIVQMPDHMREEVRASGFVRDYVPMSEQNRYKYQIDIDGNTNSWPGLFQKLLTGSPVLKVASPSGHRQWYYDRLKPWINFVPVASDMSDLVDKVCWLESHDDAARAIGEQGQALAISLDYDSQMKCASRTIAAALRYFAGRPETELRFGIGAGGHGHLRGGWFAPESDGVPAREQESRIELPRPIAPQDFVLSLDLSPFAEASPVAGQRIVVAANGEVLGQATVLKRRSLHCHLSRQTITAAETLTISLLHPDAVCMASASHPLDERRLSVVLHGLNLTPVGVYAAPGAVAPVVQRLRPAQEDREAHDLYGPDLWLPQNVALQHVFTHHGTMLFAHWVSGQLQHGPPLSSPRNVLLVVIRGRAYLLHMAADGERYTIRIPPEQATKSAADNWCPSGALVQGFRTVQVADGESSSFGLTDGGLFLCAESDGRVTLSRQRPGPWERFQAMPTALATSSEPTE